MTPSMYPPTETPSAADWGLMRAYLARLGVPQQDIVELLGNKYDDYTRKQMAENIRNYARDLPKAEG